MASPFPTSSLQEYVLPAQGQHSTFLSYKELPKETKKFSEFIGVVIVGGIMLMVLYYIGYQVVFY